MLKIKPQRNNSFTFSPKKTDFDTPNVKESTLPLGCVSLLQRGPRGLYGCVTPPTSQYFRLICTWNHQIVKSTGTRKVKNRCPSSTEQFVNWLWPSSLLHGVQTSISWGPESVLLLMHQPRSTPLIKTHLS